MPKLVPKDELLQMAGQPLETSAWVKVNQERINLFADATDDHQFIHVDPERAAQTPFGSTIAHGFLTLSLLPHLAEETSVWPENTQMGINYGLNKVRFLQPVKAGSEVRLHSKIASVVEKRAGHLLITTEVQVEIKGEDKPALLAETLALFILA
ncbi:MAG: MaoC family dehydratase [Acidobacteriota bacterium]